MKKNYQAPKSLLLSLTAADVITLSGVGEILDWEDGVDGNLEES